jgi:hypothetical protein
VTVKLRLCIVFLLVGLTLVLTWAVAASGVAVHGAATDWVAPAPQTTASLSHTAVLSITPPFTTCLPLVSRNYFYYFDDFSNPDSGWSSGDDSARAWGYLSGEYRIVLKTTDSGWAVSPDLMMPSDYRVEANARQTSSTPGSYGLMFGVGYSGSAYEGYQVIVYPATQEYLLNKRSLDGTWTTLIDWTYNAVINPGTASNHLRVDRIGTSIHIYVNSVLVATFSDSSFTGSGRDAGVRAYSYDAVPVDMRFDNFKVTYATLATPLYQEDFSVTGRWYTGDETEIRWSYQGGEYEILLRNADWWGAVIAPLGGGLPNYAIEAGMRFPGGNLGGYGLNFGQIDWDRFYSFTVYPGTQRYGLWKRTDSGWTTIVAETYSSYINPGTATNHLKVERIGDQINLYVNDHLLTTVNDSSYVGNLRVGLYAESITTAPVTARFDDFRFSELGAITAMQTLSVPLVVAPADSSEFSYGPAR